ncbi:MAG: hypothetical protein ACR2PL_27545 [Dehalococcoidia bacterium]
MAQGQPPIATAGDIQAVGEKLEEFCRDLTPGQRAVVAWLLQRAATASAIDAGVQGYGIVFEKLAEAMRGTPSSFQFETTWSLDATPSQS